MTRNPFTGVEDKDFAEDGRVNRNGRLAVSQAFKKAKILILDDNPIPADRVQARIILSSHTIRPEGSIQRTASK